MGSRRGISSNGWFSKDAFRLKAGCEEIASRPADEAAVVSLSSHLPIFQATHYLPRCLAYAKSVLSRALPSDPSKETDFYQGKNYKGLKV